LGNALVPCLLGPGDVLVHTKALGDGDAAEGGGETANEDNGVHLMEAMSRRSAAALQRSHQA